MTARTTRSNVKQSTPSFLGPAEPQFRSMSGFPATIRATIEGGRGSRWSEVPRGVQKAFAASQWALIGNSGRSMAHLTRLDAQLTTHIKPGTQTAGFWALKPLLGAIKALYRGDLYNGPRLLPDPLGAMNAHASCPDEEAKKPAGRTPKTHGRNTRRGPGGGRGEGGRGIGNFLRFLLR